MTSSIAFRFEKASNSAGYKHGPREHVTPVFTAREHRYSMYRTLANPWPAANSLQAG